MQVLQDYLPLKELLMATLSETCELTSATNVAKKVMTVPTLSENRRLLWSHSSVFVLEKKRLKNAKFDGSFLKILCW